MEDAQLPLSESTAAALTDRAACTMVSNQTDALNLLFEAAEAYHTNGASIRPAAWAGPPSDIQIEPRLDVGANSYPSTHTGTWRFPTYELLPFPEETLKTFSKLNFVRKRWITAQEAATYVELYVYTRVSLPA
jgi:hypothetical protein